MLYKFSSRRWLPVLFASGNRLENILKLRKLNQLSLAVKRA